MDSNEVIMSDQILQLLPKIMPEAYFGQMVDEVVAKPITQIYPSVKTSRAWANKQLHRITGAVGREGIYHESILESMKLQYPDLLPEIQDYESIIEHADQFLKLIGKNPKGNNLIAQKIKAKGYVVTKIEPEPIEFIPEPETVIPPISTLSPDPIIHLKRNSKANQANTYCNINSNNGLLIFGDRLNTTCPDCEASYDPQYKIINKHPIIKKVIVKKMASAPLKPNTTKRIHPQIIKTHRILRSIKWLSEYLFSVNF